MLQEQSVRILSFDSYFLILNDLMLIFILIESGDIKQGIGINSLEGKSGGIYVEGFLMFCCVILAMQYKVALMTSLWTWIHVALWLLSLAGKFYLLIFLKKFFF